ncbi:MAG: NADP-dependent malic enzyme, partial [Caldilineaceae bacterium]|nr:NADP-dependent malic enzyme [Caldilineaceae bacterium]
IDVFDIEVNERDIDRFVDVVAALEPTFGGINLEDIKAPECFYIEQELQKLVDIPVFHDDQHGTAIISGAGLINALEIIDKPIADITIVVNGAGAAGIACADFYCALGARKENIIMCDSKGVIYKGRTAGMNEFKEAYAVETDKRTLADALVDADVFIGLSVANILTREMVRSMGRDPIIFAMANPDPEITYEEAQAARSDTIFGTGRSDYPNQVNNVLGFPFIFRGALDVRAKSINMDMKIACAKALADLAKEDVPDSVMRAYGVTSLRYGREYIIPKPVDPRVLLHVAPAVAKAAMESGVARIQIDLEAYKDQLAGRQGKGVQVMRNMEHKAQRDPKRVVFAEGEQEKIIRAAHALETGGIARPILLGRPKYIRKQIEEMGLEFSPEIHYPLEDEERAPFAEAYYQRRQRRGATALSAVEAMRRPNYFGAMLVQQGEADAFISGLTYNNSDVLQAALQVVGAKEGRWVSGAYLMLVQDRIFIFTDTTVNPNPSADQLAAIAMNAAELALAFDLEPRIAMLSFSNFGSVDHEDARKVRRATEIVRQQRPDLIIDGEMQADVAVSAELMEERYPFSEVRNANVLVFPDADAANAAVKLMSRLGGAEAIGPVVLGMNKPIHLLPTGADVRDIINVAILATVDAQDANVMNNA